MDISEQLKDPMMAAAFAGLVTAAYIHVKNQMNSGEKLELSAYAKPAALVALLVYFIVCSGSQKEKISSDPF